MRREHDFYPTPGWATQELLKRITVSGYVLEPCVGAGDISRELWSATGVHSVGTNDLDRRHAAEQHEDATDPAWWKSISYGTIDWVVTNPPFSEAHKILPLALKYANNVAMLLRLTFLEPCEGRGPLLAERPPSDLIVLPRISFTGDGNTDSVTCAWFVWASDHQQSIQIVVPVDEQQPSLLESA